MFNIHHHYHGSRMLMFIYVHNYSEKMPVISSSVLCDNCDASNLNISDPVRYQLVVNKTVSSEVFTVVVLIIEPH